MSRQGWRGERGVRRLASLGRQWRGQWDQLCELPEVLGRCGKEEHVSSAQRASWPETVEAQDAALYSKATPSGLCTLNHSFAAASLAKTLKWSLSPTSLLVST